VVRRHFARNKAIARSCLRVLGPGGIELPRSSVVTLRNWYVARLRSLPLSHHVVLQGFLPDASLFLSFLLFLHQFFLLWLLAGSESSASYFRPVTGVCYAKLNFLSIMCNRDLDFRRTRMPMDVRQTLLNDPKDSNLRCHPLVGELLLYAQLDSQAGCARRLPLCISRKAGTEGPTHPTSRGCSR